MISPSPVIILIDHFSSKNIKHNSGFSVAMICVFSSSLDVNPDCDGHISLTRAQVHIVSKFLITDGRSEEWWYYKNMIIMWKFIKKTHICAKTGGSLICFFSLLDLSTISNELQWKEWDRSTFHLLKKLMAYGQKLVSAPWVQNILPQISCYCFTKLCVFQTI